MWVRERNEGKNKEKCVNRAIVPDSLYGQRRCARIDWTFGLFWIHSLLDPTLKETSQVPTYELVVLQTITRHPMKKSEQRSTHTPELYSTFC